MKKQFFLFFLIAVFISSCKKDAPVNLNPAGSVIFKFINMAGDSNLILNNIKTYINAHNDTFSVHTFKYYISNIKLTRNDGTIFSEKESYHLIDAGDSKRTQFTLANVPYGNYTAVSFIIGVDSVRNFSGAQTGDLDPALGMFWMWDTGYIFAELAGSSPQDTAHGLNHFFSYAIIGYSGQYNALKTVRLPFYSDTAKVSPLITPQVNLKADVLEWFKTPTIISFAAVPFTDLPNQTTLNFANNYADMFTLQSIRN